MPKRALLYGVEANFRFEQLQLCTVPLFHLSTPLRTSCGASTLTYGLARLLRLIGGGPQATYFVRASMRSTMVERATKNTKNDDFRHKQRFQYARANVEVLMSRYASHDSELNGGGLSARRIA